jgi:sugar phosphate isomerase/epimerase
VSPSRAIADRLGIFARTFPRDTPDAVAAEVARAGYVLAHWNFVAIGLPTLAEGVDRETFGRVRTAFDARGVAIPSVSATFNIAHPDRERRRRETIEAGSLIARTPTLGATVATLCSGTRDPRDMWHGHPENESAAAWSDMRATLDVLLDAADTAGIRLGIEPEPGNIVRDAPTAARLLDELGAEAPAGIVLDPANLLAGAGSGERERILGEAVDLLGPRVVSVHLKGAAPVGVDRVTRVPLIVQDVREADAARVREELLSRPCGGPAPSASASAG